MSRESRRAERGHAGAWPGQSRQLRCHRSPPGRWSPAGGYGTLWGQEAQVSRGSCPPPLGVRVKPTDPLHCHLQAPVSARRAEPCPSGLGCGPCWAQCCALGCFCLNTAPNEEPPALTCLSAFPPPPDHRYASLSSPWANVPRASRAPPKLLHCPVPPGPAPGHSDCSTEGSRGGGW